MRLVKCAQRFDRRKAQSEMVLVGIKDQTPELQTLLIRHWTWAWKRETDQYMKHTCVFLT
jgi:hypothetical protein